MTRIVNVTEVLKQAGRNLGLHFIHAAEKSRKINGFGYKPVENAPSTIDDLAIAYVNARRTGAFPVWEGGSTKTIYGSKEANWAFRYLHDIAHIHSGLGMTTLEEVELAYEELPKVERAFGTGSTEATAYLLDTAAQSIYEQHKGYFPDDQVGFAAAVYSELLMQGKEVSPKVIDIVKAVAAVIEKE